MQILPERPLPSHHRFLHFSHFWPSIGHSSSLPPISFHISSKRWKGGSPPPTTTFPSANRPPPSIHTLNSPSQRGGRTVGRNIHSRFCPSSPFFPQSLSHSTIAFSCVISSSLANCCSLILLCFLRFIFTFYTLPFPSPPSIFSHKTLLLDLLPAVVAVHSLLLLFSFSA